MINLDLKSGSKLPHSTAPSARLPAAVKIWTGVDDDENMESQRPRWMGEDRIERRGDQLVVCSKVDMDEWQVRQTRKTAIYINDEVWCLAFSLLGSMQLNSPKGSVWHSMYLFVIYAGLMLAIIKYGSLAIKKHLTYPRTGFVEYRKQGVISRFMVAGAIAGLTTVGICITVQRHWDLTILVSLFGLFLRAAMCTASPGRFAGND